MNVGELFVSLGVKGSEKTLGAITGMQKGLKETASVSLEAKAAIVGAMYALERLFATSGQAGTDLTNFNSVIGVSTKTLQQYQYAARQMGVSNKEVESTFKTLQSTMTKTLMGEGAPKGLARVSMLTGGMTAADLKKFAEQPQLLIQKLQEYASKETNAGLRREVLSSFGVSEGMQAAMARGAFTPNALARAPAYSEKEIQSLDRANIAWSNLGNKIEMTIGHFNAMHGGQLVSEISKITDGVLKLADALFKFAEKAHGFELIGKAFSGWNLIIKGLTDNVDKLDLVFQGWADIFDGITTALTAIMEATKGSEGTEKLKESVAGFFTNDAPNMFKTLTDEVFGESPIPSDPVSKKNTEQVPKPGYGERIGNAFLNGGQGESLVGIVTDALKEGAKVNVGGTQDLQKPTLRLVVPPSPALGDAAKSIAPSVAPVSGAGSTQNIEVNQTLKFEHDGTDPKKTGDSVKKSVKDAFRQLSAQSQGS